MSGTTFAVDYAKRVSNCKKCKQQLPKEGVRIAKVVPNPFGSDGGDMKQYYHIKCLFESFERSRATTRVIESPADIDEWASLEQSDKDDLLKLIKDLDTKRAAKKDKAASPKKTPPKPLPTGQKKIDEVFGGTSKKEEAKKNDDASGDEKATERRGGTKDDSWYEFCKLCRRIAENSKYTAKSSVVKDFITDGTSGKLR